MMNAIIFLTELEATNLQTRIDAEFGYPICWCGLYVESPTCICGYVCKTPKRLGNGIFNTTCSFNITLSHATPLQHPVSNSWVYPITSQSLLHLTAQELLQVTSLSNDWYSDTTGSIVDGMSGSI